MDNLHDVHRPHRGASNTGSSIPEERAIAESPNPAASASTSRLQRKRSNAGTRRVSQSRKNKVAGLSRSVSRTHNGEDQEVGRRSTISLRNVIKRMLRRRSKKDARPVPRASPSSQRFAFRESEPPRHVSAALEDADRPAQLLAGSSVRGSTVPLALEPIPAVPPLRSPYAVEFPQSSRLKPLDLGNPFDAPGSRLRRRKTLPSILVSDKDASMLKAAIQAPDDLPILAPDRIISSQEVADPSSTLRREKRRSRSETDLGATAGGSVRPVVPERQQGDELRLWRESFRDTALRASGFTVPGTETAAAAESARDMEAGRGALRATASGIDVRASTHFDGDLSQDLENRVARLEHGLQSFQASLDQLATRPDHRTVLATNNPPNFSAPNPRRGRPSVEGRTASMLADTLAPNAVPYAYQPAEIAQSRLLTSPQPPRTPMAMSADRPVPAPPLDDDPFVLSSPPYLPHGPQQHPHAMTESATGDRPTSQTVRSLYEMLSDERSARRRLEDAMRCLQDEIANLHSQVGAGASDAPGQRSSYLPSSSRLQALLAETGENSPPHSSRGLESRFADPTLNARVVSRFSDSESETENLAEFDAGSDADFESPAELYETPAENYNANRHAFHDRNDMFSQTDNQMF